jgi:hypothetical protein
MVELAEIQIAYYMVAATGVLVAAAYYVVNIRSNVENRKAQHLMEFNRIMNSKAWLIDLHESMNYEWKDWPDFWAKYGHSNPEAHCKWIFILNSYGNLFSLLERRLIDEEMARGYLGPVSFMPFWEKFSPCIREMRVLLNDPDMCKSMEFYYNKWKKA